MNADATSLATELAARRVEIRRLLEAVHVDDEDRVREEQGILRSLNPIYVKLAEGAVPHGEEYTIQALKVVNEKATRERTTKTQNERFRKYIQQKEEEYQIAEDLIASTVKCMQQGDSSGILEQHFKEGYGSLGSTLQRVAPHFVKCLELTKVLAATVYTINSIENTAEESYEHDHLNRSAENLSITLENVDKLKRQISHLEQLNYQKNQENEALKSDVDNLLSAVSRAGGSETNPSKDWAQAQTTYSQLNHTIQDLRLKVLEHDRRCTEYYHSSQEAAHTAEELEVHASDEEAHIKVNTTDEMYWADVKDSNSREAVNILNDVDAIALRYDAMDSKLTLLKEIAASFQGLFTSFFDHPRATPSPPAGSVCAAKKELQKQIVAKESAILTLREDLRSSVSETDSCRHALEAVNGDAQTILLEIDYLTKLLPRDGASEGQK